MNYLQQELYQLFQSDSTIVDFIENGSLDGMWYWDLEQPENEWLSPQFWCTLGIDPNKKKHLASEWQDLIHPDDLALALDNFHKHCADPSHKYDQYVRYLHTDGHWVHIRCRGMAIRDAQGKAIRMLGAHTDVTNAATLEEKKQLLDKATKLNDELTLFTYSVSHDLQAPVSSLKGLYNLLADDLNEKNYSALEETLEHMQKKIMLLDSLLQSILLISKLSSSAPEKASCNLSEVIDEVIQEFQPQLAETNEKYEFIKIDIDNAKLPLPTTLMYRVLLNLFSNSFKYRKKIISYQFPSPIKTYNPYTNY